MKVFIIYPHSKSFSKSMFIVWNNIYNQLVKNWIETEKINFEYKSIFWIWKIDELINRFFLYPRFLKKKFWNQKWIFYIVDHSYSNLINSLPLETTLIEVNDLIPLKFAKQVWFFWYISFYLNIQNVKKAKYITTISENTKNDLLKFFKNNLKWEIIVNLLWFDKNLFNYDRNYKRNSNKFTFIMVWSIFYKNILTQLKALSLLPKEVKQNIRLIKIWKFNKLENEFILDNLNDIEIDEKQNINDDILVTSYRESDVLLFCSMYEWFWLPILESYWIWVNVITSENSSMSEVWKDWCLYADPNDYVDIKNKILMLYKNKQLREYLQKRWFEITQNFWWEVCVEKLLNIYKKIYENWKTKKSD